VDDGLKVMDAFPWYQAPRYLLRDRDSIYGASFRQRVCNMGIEEVVIAPRSPSQNPYMERLIGCIRRECLDHVSASYTIVAGASRGFSQQVALSTRAA
jgi:transposase InsO family protein